MRVAYFDCPSGIAGNMILGALLDAGLPAKELTRQLHKLEILNPKSEINYKLEIRKTKRHGLAGTQFNVKVKPEKRHRSLADIITIIKQSKLSVPVKKLSSLIFRRLAEAEAKVHGIPVNQVHFHEVGAVDAIIDIVGACIGLEKLGIEKVYCSPLPNGRGKIIHAHGLLPNPSPAAAELLKGVPTYGAGIKGELVTPTGAAIISTLAESFGDIPRLEVENIGYGAGSIDLPIPNLLRVFIGEAQLPAEKDAILQIETSIDDLAPKLYNLAIKKIMKAGALDAYIEPILMKKGRRGVKLTVLTAPEKKDPVLEELFRQTTTFGARVYLVPREKLSRKFVKVKTKFGQARVKLGILGKKVISAAPEFVDYQKLARKHAIPIQAAYRTVRTSI